MTVFITVLVGVGILFVLMTVLARVTRVRKGPHAARARRRSAGGGCGGGS
ncbi:hypothetical protein LUR56_32525 [Streptomyces sp. MT29]|nr:hypothetical protein [Streptomyces sp. MT29]